MHKFNQSLSFRLTIPVVLISLFTLVVIIIIEIKISEKQIIELIERQTSLIIDTLAIASETDSSRANVQRITLTLAANFNLPKVRVLDIEKRSILTTNKPNELDGVIEQNLSSIELVILNNYVETGSLKETVSDEYPIVYQLGKLHLFDKNINRLKPYTVLLSFNITELSESVRTQLYLNLVALIAGLITTLIAMYLVQRRVLISPLKSIIFTIKESKEDGKRGFIKYSSSNELGLLAKAYNRLTVNYRERQNKLEKQRQQLEVAIEDSQTANKIKSQFIANVSHEIRTPMNGVLGMLGLLEKTNLNSNQQHKLSLAKFSAESLLALINDVLDFSKIEAGKLELEKIDFNLVETVQNIVEANSISAYEKGLEVILDVNEIEQEFVRSDPDKLSQILINLIGNAIKFTSHGEISIKLQLEEFDRERLNLIISVSDSGIGIPKDKQHGLFESFSQADFSTTRQYGGTGLGLAITKQLCNLMHGEVTVTSEENKGSNFTINILVEKSSNKNNRRLFIQEKFLVLVISPMNSICINLQESLDKLNVAGYSYTSILSAKEYLSNSAARIDSSQRIVVILDIELGVSSIEEFVEVVKSQSYYSRCVIAILTHALDQENFEAKFAIDNAIRIYKPASKKVLSDLIWQLQTNTGSSSEEVSFSEDESIFVEKSEKVVTTASRPTQFQANVLIVEDNPVNQAVVEGILEEYGLALKVVANGKEAVEQLKTSPDYFDIVFMDCQMPVMDGYEATKRIRSGNAGEKNKAVTIVALTANTMKQDREKCFSVGMNDFLPKPIEPENIEVILKKYLT